MFELTRRIADARARVARQAERGVIRALRVGKPDAKTAFESVMPIQKMARRHRRAMETHLTEIELG